MIATRRSVLKLAAFASSAAALSGAVRAEGGADAGALPAASLPFAQTTPMHVGAAALRVRDMAAMRRYYTDLLGLATIREDQGEVVLGVDGVALLHLIHRPNAPLEGRRAAGLFHTAFLMPSREDFARWLVHAARNRIQFTGFADHNVSEASYLDDPEGNGIEVYSDRTPSSWQWQGDTVTMSTDQLDIESILKLADVTRDEYGTAPKYLRIGHVHLRVGEVDRGRDFYERLVGLDLTRGRNGAAFLSSGRYHHHLGINTWSSQGAGLRDPQQTGLAWFSLAITDQTLLADRKARFAASGTTTEVIGNGIEVADPWGTRVRLVSASA